MKWWAVVREVEAMEEIMICSLDILECIDQFWYLGDLIGASRRAEEALRARVCFVYAKFRELALVLTIRGASIKWRKSIQCLYPTCLEICEWKVAYESGGYGKIAFSFVQRDLQAAVLMNIKPNSHSTAWPLCRLLLSSDVHDWRERNEWWTDGCVVLNNLLVKQHPIGHTGSIKKRRVPTTTQQLH